jgi:hypothetical protein
MTWKKRWNVVLVESDVDNTHGDQDQSKHGGQRGKEAVVLHRGRRLV